MIVGVTIRVLVGLSWAVIALLAIPIACHKKRDNLWGWLFYCDNSEDGFDGDKLGWYSNYLGEVISKDRPWRRAYLAYKWSVLRNSCFNLREHPWVGTDVTNPRSVKYSGNTYFHTPEWHYEPDYKGLLWYWMSAKYNGKRRHSVFLLIPVPWTKYRVYLRAGLKVYPRHYFDKYWVERIKKEGWPEAKKYGLPAISIRVRKYE